MTAQIIINADLGDKTISRHIYGHFAEHLGRCVYDGLWVGEDSAIPNVRGIRTDIVEALRAINMPNLRWPGGCYADAYHWRDGIGPKSQRPGRLNIHWGNVADNNHFGTHEFMDLCEQLACEAYICGNVGSGTVQEMRDWVEYLTCDGNSELANLRRTNGRQDPWRVGFWGIGNENWGCGGNMRPEYYADLYRQYHTYIRDYGANKLCEIASGMGGSDVHSTEVLMRQGIREGHRPMMDAISLHYYAYFVNRKYQAIGFDESQWFDVLKESLAIETLLQQHIAVMDRYDPDKLVGLMVDEWGAWYAVDPGMPDYGLYQQNTIRDAIVAGLTLHTFHEHCDRVQMANIAQLVNVLQSLILTRGEAMLLTPTYHVFEMFKVHQDAILLPLAVSVPAYNHGDDEIPSLSASASRDKQGRIHISMCNLDPNSTQEITCDVRGQQVTQASGRILTGATMDAHNTFDAPDVVKPQVYDGVTLEQGKLTLQLPVKSVVVLELQ